jgi:hypothetical protein
MGADSSGGLPTNRCFWPWRDARCPWRGRRRAHRQSRSRVKQAWCLWSTRSRKLCRDNSAWGVWPLANVAQVPNRRLRRRHRDRAVRSPLFPRKTIELTRSRRRLPAEHDRLGASRGRRKNLIPAAESLHAFELVFGLRHFVHAVIFVTREAIEHGFLRNMQGVLFRLRL